MVLVTTDKGESYCIDQREVLQSEYHAFAQAKGSDTSGQPPECADNEVYWPPEPDNSGLPTPGACPKGALDPVAKAQYPMVCVDFCDAAAYCKWAGKRLCGSLDHPGEGMLKLNYEERTALLASGRHEWAHACSQGGTTVWPYGDAYEPGRCIDKARFDAEGPDARRVANLDGETCHGTKEPYSDIYHMSGSVSEWVNMCDEGDGSCGVLGGSFGGTPEQLSCKQSAVANWLGISASYGIRCCADLE